MESIPSTLIQKQEQQIAKLQHQVATLQSENTRVKAAYNQVSAENRKLKQQFNWEHRLFSNPHLSASQKLALWAIVPEISAGTPDERGLTHVNITYMSKKIGMSPKTTGRNLQELAEARGLVRRESPYIASDGNRQTHILFAETRETPRPHLIKPATPRNHGGLRQRCNACGSENLVKEIKIICQDCGSEQSRILRSVNPTMSPQAQECDPELTEGHLDHRIEDAS